MTYETYSDGDLLFVLERCDAGDSATVIATGLSERKGASVKRNAVLGLLKRIRDQTTESDGDIDFCRHNGSLPSRWYREGLAGPRRKVKEFLE